MRVLDGAIIDSTEAKYIDAFTDQLFGNAALQVPFIQHNDPARAVMGAKNLKQAVPLKDPEVPIICTGYEETVAEESGRIIRSEESGQVIKVSNDEIVIRNNDNKQSRYELIEGIPSVMSKSAFYHLPTVQVGQVVDKNQIIVEGAGIKDGKLALGANFLVAYMPYFGWNMDDGIVVSKSVCEKFTSLHIEEFEIKNKDGDIPVWLVKEGVRLQRVQDKKSPSRFPCIAILKRVENRKKEEVTVYAKKEMLGGIVKKIFIEPERIRLWILKEKCLEAGDKLTGRHGNKGVVAKILSKNEMPYFDVTKNGKIERRYVDVILNPHGVISRMNIGQIFETHLAWVAKEHPDDTVRQKASMMGKPFTKVDTDNISSWLKDSGLDGEGKVILRLNDDSDVVNPVVVGYQYLVKLNHMASTKLSLRGDTGPVSYITEMPLSGKKRYGGQRLGEMEVWAVLAHGGIELVREMLGEKANAYRLDTGAVSISESLKILVFYLRGLGICLDFLDQDDKVIAPEDFEKLSKNKLEKYRIRWATNIDMANWGQHMAGKVGDQIIIKEGPKRILTLGELYPEYKDETGYIHLTEEVTLCGRETKILPVIPLRCRPHHDNRINKFYNKIFLSNLELTDLIRNHQDRSEDYQDCLKKLRNSVENLEKEISKLMQGKNGVIRRTILGKRVKFSARAVIVPDPEIDADTVLIPKEIMKELKIKEGNTVLLNRQPSLHSHNIQAFKALIGRNKTIAINPLVCGGFNADFDGDTMAVYKPDKAIPEGMNVSEQIILAANGKLNLHLSQDIVAGIYHASRSEDGRKEFEELINDKDIYKADPGKSNLIDEGLLKGIVYRYLLKNDRIKTLRLAEKISKFGFKWATLSGLTFSIFDLNNFLITDPEKKSLSYDNNSIESAIDEKLRKAPANPISIMVLSGARGNKTQIRRMAGVQGKIPRLGRKETNERVDACYLEGLSPTEYYLACYGARNSLGDKKLLTPHCGYLTRRLVYAAADMVIVEEDCKTDKGIKLDIAMAPGRTALNEITHNGHLILNKNEIITEAQIEELKKAGVTEVNVRSPIYCLSPKNPRKILNNKGICSNCYGWHLSSRIKPKVGFAAGIIAAEVIGERATQDAMRTYHVGTATVAISLFDKVKAIFDNTKDPETGKKISEDVRDINDVVQNAHRLYKYYEGKVDIKHYEVILRALFNGGQFIGTKDVIKTGSLLHASSFEKTIATIKKSAEDGNTCPINTIFEKLFF